jgi:hypothetical protein
VEVFAAGAIAVFFAVGGIVIKWYVDSSASSFLDARVSCRE